MVRLTKIYTRTGDGGQTRLGDMSQVSKTSLRIDAYGCVDELNSAIGLARSDHSTFDELLGRVQNDLFDLGADLCVPCAKGEVEGERLRMKPDQVQFLENRIDRINAKLEPLKSFVLPGGCPLSAHLHLARAICRRAERQTWKLADAEDVSQPVLEYLNRLSDLLFVLARAANLDGSTDVLWKPGEGTTGE